MRAMRSRSCAAMPSTFRSTCIDLLQSGAGESVKPGDARLPQIETHLIATPQMALEAAAKVASDAGVACHILSDSIEGEARDVGKVMAGIALQVKHGAAVPTRRACCCPVVRRR